MVLFPGCKKHFCLLLAVCPLVFCFVSCKDEQTVKPVFEVSSFAPSISLEMDTLSLEPGNYSGQGFFRLINDKVFFFDTKFFLVTGFDSMGNAEQSWLGMGEDSTEIEQFITCTLLPGNEDRLFFANDYNFRKYDSTWHKKSAPYLLKRKRKKGGFETDDLSIIGMYDFNWESSSLSTLWLPVNSKSEIFIPLNITRKANKKVNKFTDPDLYFKNARTFGKVNSGDGAITQIAGNYPDSYVENKYLTMFSNMYMAKKKDSILVSYEADKGIYVYSPDLKPQYAFGLKGQLPMKTDYPLTGSHEDFYNTKFADSCELNFGYYTHLFYDEKSDLLFRSYTTGYGDHSGVQVYRDRVCIGDFKVPRRFNVIGRIGDYYYADGSISNNKIEIFRFKINTK